MGPTDSPLRLTHCGTETESPWRLLSFHPFINRSLSVTVYGVFCPLWTNECFQADWRSSLRRGLDEGLPDTGRSDPVPHTKSVRVHLFSSFLGQASPVDPYSPCGNFGRLPQVSIKLFVTLQSLWTRLSCLLVGDGCCCLCTPLFLSFSLLFSFHFRYSFSFVFQSLSGFCQDLHRDYSWVSPVRTFLLFGLRFYHRRRRGFCRSRRSCLSLSSIHPLPHLYPRT